MTTLRLLLPTGRLLLIMDLLLAVWVAFWVWLGISIGNEVKGLQELSGTVGKVGHAIEETGQTLRDFGAIPVIGGNVDDTAGQIEDAGQSTILSARSSRESVQQLSWMLALAIAVIPALPVVGFYVPLRVFDSRERRRLRELARTRYHDTEFRRYLAHRALFTLPYRALPPSDHDPWLEYAAGRFDRLAEAELRRLGIDRPPSERRRS